jgi:UDP-N-acetylglucosamine 3-dehydrogenase
MYRIGIVGAGRLARTHVRHLKRVGKISFGIYDSVASAADLMASEVGGTAVDTYEALLEKSDAIMVVTPNDLHVEFAIQAVQDGKAVFVEKPVSTNLIDAKRLLDAGGNVTVGHVLRHFPMYKKARRVVHSGDLGNLAAVRMMRGGKMPGAEGSWFQDHSRSGGVFIDLGIHDFDWLLWTLGPVKEVFARSVGASAGSGADYGLGTLTMANGAVCHVESTWMDPQESRMAFEVCGSKGMIEYDSRNAASLRSMGSTEQPNSPDNDPFFLQMRAFIDSARDGKPVEVGVDEAYAALEVAVAALESAKTGKMVTVGTI